MQPLLKPGDEVLLNPDAYRYAQPQVDDIVVALHPQIPQLRIIKRVTARTAEGACVLKGDNAVASQDSRAFGAVALGSILGKVVCRF